MCNVYLYTLKWIYIWIRGRELTLLTLQDLPKAAFVCLDNCICTQ